MKCEEFRNIVFELAAGELDEKTAEAAKAHMENCSGCRKEYETVQELTASLREMGDQKAPADLLPNVMGRIRAEKAGNRFNFIRYGAAAAAAVLLVVGAVKVLPGIVKDPGNIEESGSAVHETRDAGETAVEDVPAVTSGEGGEAVYDGGAATVDADAAESEKNENENPTPLAADSADGSVPKAVQKTVEAPPVQGVADSAASESSGKNSGSSAYAGVGQGTAPLMTAIPKKEESAGTETVQNADGKARNTEEASFDAIMTLGLDGDDAAVLENGGGADEDGEPENEPAQILSADDLDSGAGTEGHSGGGGGSGGAGAVGGKARTAVPDSGEFQIMTAGLANGEPVVEAAARRYIHRRVRFTVGAEFAGAVSGISAAGKSMSQVSDELKAAGVDYEVYVIEDDYTDEYKNANKERRAQIEAMCAGDQCSIETEQTEMK